ncbi:Uncharacterized protein OBRU01_12544, partial [Operophtera brumata]
MFYEKWLLGIPDYFKMINPITSENMRWSYNHPEAAQYAGDVPDVDRFDAQFFKGAKIYVTAGLIIRVSPEHLFGKKVGVYIGSCFSETEKSSFYVTTSRTGFGVA